jgi:P27 family predicted phage terminase small subunit
MARGRRPKPISLKILSGTARAGRLPKDEPRPECAAPRRPSWITGRARAEWDRVVPLLLSLGLLSKLDLGALASYCIAVANLETETRTLEREGRIIEIPVRNRHGDEIGKRKVAHPSVKSQRDAMAEVKSFLAEFGLSPSSRTRVTALPAPEGPDELSKIMTRNRFPDKKQA